MRLFKKMSARNTILAAAPVLLPGFAQAACNNTPSQGSLISPVVFCSVQDFVVAALQILVTISLPIIGFFIVFVGYQFIAAQGNSAKLQKARENFVYVIIGAGLILGAWALATLIGSTVSQLLG
jgi:hypothetical protein